MTADPDTVAPDVEARDRVHQPLRARLPAHPGRRRTTRLVGIVSMRDLMRIAKIQPAETLAHEVPQGLEGVVVAETTVGDVRGLEGFYHYRQYNAVELAEKRPLEDVWHLMFEGALPDDRSRARRVRAPRSRRGREIPDAVERRAPRDRARRRTFVPLDMLRTTVSLFGAALGFRPSLDVDARELRRQRAA